MPGSLFVLAYAGPYFHVREILAHSGAAIMLGAASVGDGRKISQRCRPAAQQGQLVLVIRQVVAQLCGSDAAAIHSDHEVALFDERARGHCDRVNVVHFESCGTRGDTRLRERAAKGLNGMAQLWAHGSCP